MIYVLDTHPLIWFVARDARLSSAAAMVMNASASRFVIPTMTLVEIRHLRAKSRITVDLADVYRDFINVTNCLVYPLDEQVISMIPTGPDIHDSIIVATAIFYRDILRQPATLITKDRAITQSGLVQTLW